jgi:hypothetical protein
MRILRTRQTESRSFRRVITHFIQGRREDRRLGVETRAVACVLDLALGYEMSLEASRCYLEQSALKYER